MNRSISRRVAVSAVTCALSLLFSYLETFIPMPIPGMKIGLANLITLILLPTFGVPTAACVSLLRISLSALLFGSPVSFVYSLAGGIVSFAVTALILKIRLFGLAGASILGGVCHNLAQIVVAIFLLGTAKVFVLLPWLLLSGTVAGLAVGLLGAYLLPRLPRSLFPDAKTTVPPESSDAASSVSFEAPSDQTNDRKDG